MRAKRYQCLKEPDFTELQKSRKIQLAVRQLALRQNDTDIIDVECVEGCVKREWKLVNCISTRWMVSPQLNRKLPVGGRQEQPARSTYRRIR